MGFYSFVLLSAAVVLACINSSSKATAAAFPVQETTERPNRRSTTRFPRTSDSTGEDDEARQPLSNEVKSTVRTLKTRFRVQKWMLDWRMNDEAILKKLNIGDDLSSYLSGPNAELLYEVANAYRRRININSKSQKPLFMKLLTLHNGDEFALRSNLYTLSQSDAEFTKKAASMLLELQYREWQKDKKTVANVVTAMREKKGPDVSEIFADSNLKVLEGFIQFSDRVIDSRAALVDGLVISFGGTRKFLEVLLNPTTRHQNSDAVTKFEKVLLATWKRRRLSPEDVVIKKLGLTTADDLLSPAMTTFLKYVDYFNKRNKQKPYLLSNLAQIYGASPASKALIKADESGEKGYFRQFIDDLVNGLAAKQQNGPTSPTRPSKAGPKKKSPTAIKLLKQAFPNDEEFFLVIAKAMTKWGNNGRPTTKDDLLVVEDMSWLDDVLDAGFERLHPGAKWEDIVKNFQVGDADKPYMEWIGQKHESWLERTKGNSDVSLRRV